MFMTTPTEIQQTAFRRSATTLRRTLGPILLAFTMATGIALPAQNADSKNPSASSVADAGKAPKGDYVTVNGARLYYESEGKGEPVILIAGGPGNSHTYFQPYLSGLAASCRVIYFDSFGRGKSDRAKASSEYTVDRDVEDVEGLRKALGLGPVTILGHSYGGTVAQTYALRHPGSVRRLILSNALHSGAMWQANNDNVNEIAMNQCPEIMAQVMALRAKGVRSSSPEHAKVYFSMPESLFSFANEVNEEKLNADMNPKVYYALLGPDGDFTIGGDVAKLDFRPELKNLAMPTLILAGRYDRLALPKWAVQYKTYAPQAEFVMFEHSGHFPFVEENALFTKVVGEFIAKH